LAVFKAIVEYATVVNKLGIPWSARFYTATLDPPTRWPGYVYEVTGTVALPTDPPDAPRFQDRLEYTEPRDIIAWHRRVWHHDSPLSLEALWSPQHPVQMTIHGVERDMHLTDIQVIKDALTLLVGIRGAGRRHGTRLMTREEFHAAWSEKMAEARRRRDWPRQEDIARAYGFSLSTLTRYLHDYGRPTP
jgi:hypothetical protein